MGYMDYHKFIKKHGSSIEALEQYLPQYLSKEINWTTFICNVIEKQEFDKLKLVMSFRSQMDDDEDINNDHNADICAQGGTVEMMQLLIDNGLDITTDTIREKTTLINACCNEKPNMLIFLISCGLDVNINYGEPLIRSIDDCLIDSIKILLDAGADPNIASGAPLFYAIKSKNKLIVQLLLDNGANINLVKTHMDKQITLSDFDQFMLENDFGVDYLRYFDNKKYLKIIKKSYVHRGKLLR